MEDQLFRGRVVVFPRGLQLPAECEALGFSSWYWVVCVLPEATLNELQSNLQIAATCAGLGGSQQSQVVKLGWLRFLPGLGPLSERYKSWWLPEVSCCLFERI